jgi:pimeloyl-ACP methyl ester carboxylesterase
MHPGTPATHVLARWGHAAAERAGFRLIAVNRPGYGGSTPATVPSLLGTGRETAALAAELGLDGYGVLGISGGGPFALATAVADPGAVLALAVVGAVGPWRELDEPREADLGERESLALLDRGDVAGARAAMLGVAERELGGLRDLTDEERVDALLVQPGSPPSPLAYDPGYRALWAQNLEIVLGNLEGDVHDNLAWGGQWDVSRQQVKAPAIVFDTDQPGAYGQWYADGIPGGELIAFSGETHLDVCDSHRSEVLSHLLQLWPQ